MVQVIEKDPTIHTEEINRELSIIEDWYDSLQSDIPISELDSEIGNKLLDVQSNYQQPINSWYVLKEAFSYELPSWIIDQLEKKYSAKITSTIDPFIGCGTTGVTLAQKGIKIDGIEYNPFIRYVASIKSSANKINVDNIRNEIKELNTSSAGVQEISLPILSTFHNPDYFRKDDLIYLQNILARIRRSVPCHYSRGFLELGIARSLEPISNLRKDGRALRFVKKAHRPTAKQLLPEIWEKMLKDIEEKEYSGFNVFSGNAKNLAEVCLNGEHFWTPSNYYDLAFYSPPYLNNFDYSEIYKLELWMLGFVSSYSEWQELRRSTIRSHHSIKFNPTFELSSNEETRRISKGIEFISYSKCLTGNSSIYMPPVIRGYFDDMSLALKEQYRVLKPGGFLAYVVANSRHKLLPIATDIILAGIANCVGFKPLELIVLKKRNGRTGQKNFLRESVVFMQKPS